MVESVLEKPNVKLEAFSFGKSKGGLPEKDKAPLILENEFQSLIPDLLPYEDGLKGKNFSPEIMDSISQELSYYSRTRNLEIGTDRTKILQDIVDSMLEGKNVKARVIIMNKGQASDAFVFPDGSMFISQSLINRLSSLDGVATVLAHETGHLVNKTSERKIESKTSSDSIGISWLHESASDEVAHELLEKTGFNTSAFRDLMKELEPTNGRGLSHQTHYSRASESVGLHMGINYTTSSKEKTAIPALLKKDGEIPKTNLETALDIIRKDDVRVQDALSFLHPTDLKSAYNASGRGNTDAQIKIRETFNSFFQDRLQEAGFDSNEINLFSLFDLKDSFFQTPEEVLGAVRSFEKFFEGETLSKITQTLFAETSSSPSASVLLKNIGYNLYDLENINKSHVSKHHEVPVTGDSLLELLSIANSFGKNCWQEEKTDMQLQWVKENAISNLLMTYVEKVYLPQEKRLKGKSVEEILPGMSKRIDELLGKAALRGVIFEGTWSGLWKNREAEDLPQADPLEKNFIQQIDEDLEAGFSFYNIDRIHGLLLKLRRDFDEKDIPDSERLQYLEYFAAKIKNEDILKKAVGTDSFSNSGFPSIEQKDFQEFMSKVFKFQLLEYAALKFFKKDSEEFYTFLANTMENSGIPVQSLSKLELSRIMVNMINSVDGGRTKYNFFIPFFPTEEKIIWVHPEDLESLFSLPFFREILKKEEPLSFETIGELNKYILNFMGRSPPKRPFQMTEKEGDEFRKEDRGRRDLFSDSSYSIIFGKEARKNFLTILEKGVPEEQLGDLYDFLSLYYPSGPETHSLLRTIRRRFLESQRVDLNQKIVYFLTHSDSIGPEGAVIIADQISTLKDYRLFRSQMVDRMEDYLGGSSTLTKVALADFASSLVVMGFERNVLSTIKTDQKTIRKSSASFGNGWAGILGGYGRYDPQSRKIRSRDRQKLQTPLDMINRLKNLSLFQRFLIAHKALIDQGGALNSPYGKKALSRDIVGGLGLKSSFISSVMRNGIESISPDLLSYPAAQMLAPLLFRSLDAEEINVHPDLSKQIGAPKSELDRLMKLPTREAMLFGDKFKRIANSSIVGMTEESEGLYFQTLHELKKLFFEEDMSNKVKDALDVDPATEAIIKAVEATGAIGVRSLQLLRQVRPFSPAVDRRLSQAFDSRQQLNKLLFWENLDKLARQDREGTLRKFIEEDLVTLDEFLGGGSLYTTFAATVRDEKEEIVKAVIKLLNPNPEAFIVELSQEATKVLDDVEKTGSSRDKRFARMGKVFIDLSHQWCLKDIGDTTFVQDDEIFKKTVAGFNQEQGRETFYVPQRVVTAYNLKSEEKAEGVTVNKALNDNGVSSLRKKEIVKLMADFFEYQLTTPAGINRDGDSYYLIHSDPHVGNYIVDGESPEPRLAVIDRSMYLKISQSSASIFQKLLERGDYREFVYPFIGEVLYHNKVINPRERKAKTKSILAELTREYVKQKLENAGRFKKSAIDTFSLLRKMLGKFDEEKLEIPLEMRLMVRNVEALRELKKRYNI